MYTHIKCYDIKKKNNSNKCYDKKCSSKYAGTYQDLKHEKFNISPFAQS